MTSISSSSGPNSTRSPSATLRTIASAWDTCCAKGLSQPLPCANQGTAAGRCEWSARVAALATAVLTTAGMLAAFTPGPAAAQGVAFPGASFSGYSTGAAVHADVVNIPPNPRLVDGEVAFSGGSTNTGGLGAGVTN